jgi:transcription antitermination factor NusG
MCEPQVDPWLVLRTRSRHEKVVESILRQKQINAYLPKHKVIRRWKNTKQVVEMPLFPGYLFVQPQMNQYEGIHYIRGSCGLVRSCGMPAMMSTKDLEAVKVLVESGAMLTVDQGLIPGKRVKIIGGPFMGIEGELVRLKSQEHLVINVQLVGSSVCVEVDRDAISAL